MKIAFIVAAVIIVGLFIFFGIRQARQTASPQIDTSKNPATMTDTTQQTPPKPEGERITTPEGLVYQDIKFGTGASAETGDTVTVHYVGTLDDGTMFDASTSRGEPFSFLLGSGQVIEGWDIGIVGMKEGGIRELIIPSSLAYGEQGRQSIPPGSTLTFAVQLLQVKKP